MHNSVMRSEVISNLNLKSDGIYVDATVGYAGHSCALLKRVKRGFLFAFDIDQAAVSYARLRLSEVSSNFKVFQANFSAIPSYLKQENIETVDGIIFDLGVSSPQIDEAERGFSFMKDGPLDMRMNRCSSVSAWQVVNHYSKAQLTKVFFDFGEEKRAPIIARTIVKTRKKQSIDTTLQLVSVISEAVGPRYFKLSHPERRIFQALRIEVNNELVSLAKALPQAIKLLKKGGRLCVLTFHSLEDRIVKHTFKKYAEVDVLLKGLPSLPDEYRPLIKLINAKPIRPGAAEIKANPRCQAAKLRVVERI